MDNPKVWFDRNVDKVSSFQGNTATVFGTILHAGIEQHFSGDKLTRDDVIDYIDRQVCELDRNYILDCWGETLDELKAMATKPDEQEYKTCIIYDKYSVGGTVDYRRRKTIGDYKTCSSLKSDIGEYKYQLMAYAFIDKLNGIETDALEITYIQKPNKGYISEKTGKLIGVKPAKVSIVRYDITLEDWIEIEEVLDSIVKTYKAYISSPELKDVLYRENLLSYRK
jgi:hypothetical protein